MRGGAICTLHCLRAPVGHGHPLMCPINSSVDFFLYSSVSYIVIFVNVFMSNRVLFCFCEQCPLSLTLVFLHFHFDLVLRCMAPCKR